MHDGYDVAQVCLNGHVINWRFKNRPAHNAKYCADCGEETITNCQECNEEIRGDLIDGYIPLIISDPAPNHCDECGKPYPWTQGNIEAFQELVSLLSLDKDSKVVLSDGIEHIIQDTPKTEAKCAMFAKVISKVKPSQESRQLISMLFKIATDNAKELLSGFGVGAPP